MQELESSLRSVDLPAGRIKRNQDEALRRMAIRAQQHIDLYQTVAVEQERLRRRLEQFSNLMAQAHFEDAYAQSLAIVKNAVANGRKVPPAAVAAYEIGINWHNLSQFLEARRLCQDYWMRAMMQVELSHIPFPGSSPVKFPSEEQWH